jgi:hypothetical protein
MGGFLLVGPVSKDTIVKGNKKKHSIGGAVYYQSKVLSGLGINHTAVVTLSEEDKDILTQFHKDTVLIPFFKKETVKFENNYPDLNKPNFRIQRSNAPEIPITAHDISKVFSECGDDFEGVLLCPLLPTDIPGDTVEYIFNKNIPIYLGAQGYIREFEECDVHLKPKENLMKLLKMVKILFLDEKESRALLGIESVQFSFDDMGKSIASKGPGELVITCGDKGSYIYSHNDQRGYKIRSFPPLKLRDPTGLGDTYMASYLAQKRITSNPVDCGNFAAMVSTIKLESKKGFNRDMNYVQNRLNEYETGNNSKIL